jgi:hypothetical protein
MRNSQKNLILQNLYDIQFFLMFDGYFNNFTENVIDIIDKGIETHMKPEFIFESMVRIALTKAQLEVN